MGGDGCSTVWKYLMQLNYYSGFVCFLKSLLNFLQHCFCFMFWFCGHESCGILALKPGVEPTLLALEG